MADLGSALQSVLQVPGLQELLNSSITRNRQLEPVRTAVAQQAVNMLPNSAFNRPNIGAIPQANYTTPPPSNSGGTDWTKILSLLGAGVAGGGLLSKLLGGSGGSGAGGNLSSIVDGLRRLFQHDPRFQGNKPGPGGIGSPIGNPYTGNPFLGWDPNANNTGLPIGNPDRDPFTGWQPPIPSDPGVYYGPGGGGATVTDPSGGSGVGPGMGNYYGGDLNGGGDGGDFEP